MKRALKRRPYADQVKLTKNHASAWLNKKKPSRARLEHVCALASELCNAIDAAEEDIGGHRPVNEILADLGPACDKVEGR